MMHSGLSIFLALVVIVGLRVLGGYIFDLMALPDLCDYHNMDVETSWLFDLFFPITEVNGSHPGPGLFIYFFIFTLGISSGVVFHKYLKRNAPTE